MTERDSHGEATLEDLAEALDETFVEPEGGIPLVIELDRALRAEDLPEIEAGFAPVQGIGALGPIQRLRYSHHQLARYMARGLSPSEISGLTGYSPGYVKRLQEDPSFRQLLGNYSTERDIAFSETLERMKTLGLTALEELQKRMDEAPEEWSRREVMELARLMLVEPGKNAPGGPAGTSPAIAIAVSFVTPERAAPAPSPAGGTLLEMEPNQ